MTQVKLKAAAAAAAFVVLPLTGHAVEAANYKLNPNVLMQESYAGSSATAPAPLPSLQHVLDNSTAISGETVRAQNAESALGTRVTNETTRAEAAESALGAAATNASNITSGTLSPSRLPNPGASTLGGVTSVTGSNVVVTGIPTNGTPTTAPFIGTTAGTARDAAAAIAAEGAAQSTANAAVPSSAVGVTVAPLASPSFTGTPTVPTAAAGTNTTQAASTSYVVATVNAGATAYPGTLSISGPFSGHPIIHRSSSVGGAYGYGYGAIPVSVTLSVSVSSLQYEVVDSTSGAVIDTWRPLSGATAAGTVTFSPIASVRMGWDYIKVRANGDNSSVVTSTVPFGVGLNIAILGQSLAVDMITPSPYSAMFAAYAGEGAADVNNPPTWAVPADGTVYNSASGVMLMNDLIPLCHCNVGIVGYAVGSSPEADWLPNAQTSSASPFPHLATFFNILSGGVTGLDAIIWRQGHADAKLGTPQSVYARNLNTIIGAIDRAYPGAVHVYSTIPSLCSYSPATLQTVMAIRAAAKQVASADLRGEYVDALDAVPLLGCVHPSQAAGAADAVDYYRAVSKLWGFLPYSDVGPVISGSPYILSASPTVIHIPVTQNGGTALVGTGTPSSQFQVCLTTDPTCASPLAYNSGTPITLTANEIDLNLASSPPLGTPFYLYYRPYPDSTTAQNSTIRDNYTDSDGITYGRQLVDPATAMYIPGVGSALTVAAPSGATAGSTFALQGSYIGETPSALDYGFDNASWTAASSPTIGSGSYAFTTTAGLSAGVWQAYVRNHGDFSDVGNSAPFNVAPASPPTFPTIANHILGIWASNGYGQLYSDTSCSVQSVININPNVACARDQTGTSTPAVQLTGQSAVYAAPVYAANVLNSQPALNFVAANSSMLWSLTGVSSVPLTLQTSSGWTIHTDFVLNGMPTGSNFYEIFEVNVNATQRIRLVVLNTGIVRAYFIGDTGSITVNSGTAITSGNLVSVTFGYDGTNLNLQVNNQTIASTAVTGLTQTTAWNGYFVGAQRSGGAWQDYADMKLFDLHVWNTAFSSGNSGSLYTWAQTQF
jgi:hypothetical protein